MNTDQLFRKIYVVRACALKSTCCACWKTFICLAYKLRTLSKFQPRPVSLKDSHGI